ncbi:MAG: family 2 encapsulin nanocompartment cargo protein polyprenyl transferase [Pseudonocardiaceae bacterium]
MTTTGVIIKGRPTGEVLAESRAIVDPALRAAVDTLPPSMRRIAGYHLGWWDVDSRPASADGGKAIRPALLILSAEGTGGDLASAIPAAVAVELVHNFSLLHDDVMDGDATRRHRPTAWSMFGSNAAILAGDALLALAVDVLASSQHSAAVDCIRLLSAAVLDLVDGQNADLDFEKRHDVDLAECVRMTTGKTASLLGCTCAVGALFGGGGAEQVDRLRDFGEHVGLAFQHVDDLLGIWGDPAVTGKPVYSDLRNRKKSLPVVAALASASPAGHELAGLYYGEQPLSDAELVHAAELVDLAGGRAWSQDQADELLAAGLRQLQQAGLTTRAAAELAGLARLVTRRDH